MRNVPLLLMLLCLLLPGCGRTTPASAAQATIPCTFAADPAAIVVGKTVETERFDSLQLCWLPFSHVYAVQSAGDTLVIFTGLENTTLVWLNVPERTICGSVTLDFFLSKDDPSLIIDEASVSFYHPFDHQIVVLNHTGSITRRIAQPDGLVGPPIFCAEKNTIYYCTSSEVRAWDLQSGVRRTIAQIRYSSQCLRGIHFDGNVLSCSITDSERTETILLSVQTGQQLGRIEAAEVSLQSRGESYFLSFKLGQVQRLLYGSASQQPRILLPEKYYADTVFLPECGGALNMHPSDDRTYVITYYDLATGGKGGSLCLVSDAEPQIAGICNGRICFLIQNPDSGIASVVLWNTADASSCLSGCYCDFYDCADKPNYDIINRCLSRAAAIEERYGIKILLFQDAAAAEPWDYHLIQEDTSFLLERELAALEWDLSQFPEEILRPTISLFGDFSISLVRQLIGTTHESSLSSVAGLQYVRQTHGYLALAVGAYARQTLYHELYHTMEPYLLAHCNTFDDWEELNPDGFSYDYDYTVNAGRNAEAYLLPGQQFFIDTYSMSFPKEDRARIMEYAMLPGNADRFSSPAMQNKLHTLCQGIRAAYGLENAPDRFLWEQYLND